MLTQQCSCTPTVPSRTPSLGATPNSGFTFTFFEGPHPEVLRAYTSFVAQGSILTTLGAADQTQSATARQVPYPLNYLRARLYIFSGI